MAPFCLLCFLFMCTSLYHCSAFKETFNPKQNCNMSDTKQWINHLVVLCGQTSVGLERSPTMKFKFAFKLLPMDIKKKAIPLNLYPVKFNNFKKTFIWRKLFFNFYCLCNTQFVQIIETCNADMHLYTLKHLVMESVMLCFFWLLLNNFILLSLLFTLFFWEEYVYTWIIFTCHSFIIFLMIFCIAFYFLTPISRCS